MSGKAFTKEDSFMAKGIAILAMIFLHAFQYEEVNAAYTLKSFVFSERGLGKAAALGQICVGVFVFLTAYGIVEKCKKDDSRLGLDAGKRFLRLMLDFVFMFVFCNVLFGYFIDYGAAYEPRKRAIFYILIDGLGLANMLETPMLNSTWWYMELAYVLIIILPVGYLVLKKF